VPPRTDEQRDESRLFIDPRTDLSRCSKRQLLDDLVGDGEHARRNLDPEHLGDPQIDDELKSGGLNNRQLGRLLALEHAPWSRR